MVFCSFKNRWYCNYLGPEYLWRRLKIQVSSLLTNPVTNIYSTKYAFAALKQDGTVVTWGKSLYYDYEQEFDINFDVPQSLTDISNPIKEIVSSSLAFAALKEDRTVVTWGTNINPSPNSNEDIMRIYSTEKAFAALKEDGTVVTWGYDGGGSIWLLMIMVETQVQYLYH